MAIERVIELGKKRTALREKLAALNAELADEVRKAAAGQEDSEGNIAKAAGVDRMTVRKWTGKSGPWGKIEIQEQA